MGVRFCLSCMYACPISVPYICLILGNLLRTAMHVHGSPLSSQGLVCLPRRPCMYEHCIAQLLPGSDPSERERVCTAEVRRQGRNFPVHICSGLFFWACCMCRDRRKMISISDIHGLDTAFENDWKLILVPITLARVARPLITTPRPARVVTAGRPSERRRLCKTVLQSWLRG